MTPRGRLLPPAILGPERLQPFSMLELLVPPVAAGVIGLISLLIGHRVDNGFKIARDERLAAKTHREAIDRRHAELFEAFVTAQANATSAFEGIHRSVNHIGEELAEMRVETKEHRVEMATRMRELETTVAKHEAQIAQLQAFEQAVIQPSQPLRNSVGMQ
jgi:septal ring factor EnvC (AmiA/AmiB activator)